MYADISIDTHSIDLSDLARKIKSWRERYPNKYIPKIFWTQALDLIEYHSIEEVSRETGLKLRSLHRKLKQRNQYSSLNDVSKVEPHQFVEVPVSETHKILNVTQALTMRISDSDGLQINLSFSGSTQEVLPFIRDLIQGGENCFK